ncbi:MerR family DNA-binding transcriptional regulator [Acidovorax sp. LjRoot117]|uniref:MerR family DNA-binding transcriptional regulator n=1 Tax=Acidovorax sp. LjRoot117 TaxID=3342255 RepID=UPI003ED051E4
MQISELAQRTSISVHALRHYERLGLLTPRRRANGYRDYPVALQREVVFIAMSRQLGFTLPQIAPRLAAYRAGTLCIDAMVQDLRERALALDQQIAGLQAQKQRVLEHAAWFRAKQATARRAQAAAPKAKAQWPRVRPAPAPAAPAPPPPPASRSPRPTRKTP